MKKIVVCVTVFPLLLCGPSHAAKLTVEYLHGEWCLTHMEVGGENTEENRIWVFEPDGKFAMQQSRTSAKIKHSGYWEISNDKLEIKPVYAGGAKAVDIVSEDNFVFRWMANLNIVRGRCG